MSAEKKTRTASTAQSSDSGGSSSDTSADSPITSTSPDFVTELLLKLAAEPSPARLGKFVIRKPEDSQGELRILMVLKDDWISDKPGCLKLRDIHAFSLDKVDMYAYATHEAIAIEWDVPIDWIKGFQWSSEEDTRGFFNIHAYKDPN